MKWRNIVIPLFALVYACGNEPGDENEAEGKDSLTNILSIDSSMSDSARLVKIETLIEQQQHDEALSHIDYLLNKHPKNPALLFIKADALERKRDTSSALYYYLQADHISGKFPQARMAALNLYAETKHPQTPAYSKMMLEDPASEKIRSDIFLMQGIYYSKLGKTDMAESIFSKIIQQDYTFLQAYIEKGLLYYDRQQYKKALEIFTLSTEVKNDFAEGYFWMGKTFHKLNQKEAAILQLKRALALDPSIQEAREELKTLGAIQ
ncbi:MAG: tetratricopeptide repeat protein [Bacteroidota bacterium]